MQVCRAHLAKTNAVRAIVVNTGIANAGTGETGLMNAEKTCEKAAVIYAGEIVEYGTVHEVFKSMKHPYTIGLMNSIPKIHVDERRLHPIEGLMPDPVSLPDGCKFCNRCRFAIDKCKKENPEMVKLGGEHLVKCFRANEDLKGGYGNE